MHSFKAIIIYRQEDAHIEQLPSKQDEVALWLTDPSWNNSTTKQSPPISNPLYMAVTF